MFQIIVALLSIFLGTGNLFANTIDFNTDGASTTTRPLFVSLGSFCEVALRLRECGLREAAFPYDWLITKNHALLITMLDNDFQFFTDEEYFSQYAEHPIWVKNSYYEIYFIHDWPFPDTWTDPARYAQQLQEIKTKYERRITRFRNLRQFPNKVFFFRTSWFEETPYVTGQQAQELKVALDRYFPDLEFTLVIVNFTDSCPPTIDWINGVVDFKIRREFIFQDFQAMFRALGGNC